MVSLSCPRKWLGHTVHKTGNVVASHVYCIINNYAIEDALNKVGREQILDFRFTALNYIWKDVRKSTYAAIIKEYNYD
jgi:hypothetical protein